MEPTGLISPRFVMKNLSLLCALILTGALFGVPRTLHAADLPRVAINELMWMGSSASSADEWVELKNTTAIPIDLAGWRITKLSSGVETPMLTITSGMIPAGGFFVIANDPAETSRLLNAPQLVDAGMSLVNSKLQVTLYDAANTLVDRADDGSGSPLAGEYQSGSIWKSMERNPLGGDGTVKESWHTASVSLGFDDADKEFGTPGAENANRPAVISANIPTEAIVGESVQVDASETTDPEGDPLTFTWSWGDGASAIGATASHAYQAAGTFRISVSVHDGREPATFESPITVTDPPPAPVPPPPQPATPTQTTPASASHPAPAQVLPSVPVSPSAQLQLSELLPDPDGPDTTGEFIEIENVGSEPADLFGWKLTDQAVDFVVPTHLMLTPGASHAFFRPETKIALNNSGPETVFLVDPAGAVVNGVTYKKAVAGKSFSRRPQTDWQWTTPTPSASNVFDTTEPDDAAPSTKQSTNIPTLQKEARSATLNDVFSLPLRTPVRIRGTVIVEPGTIGSTFFYVAEGDRGLQIFSSKADFPNLGVGDVVEVSGKVGEASGERKINVSAQSDIVVVDTGDAPDPVPYGPDVPTGTLVVVEGTVAKKTGSGLTIEALSGSVKVSFARGAGIETSALTTRTAVRIVGLWRATKDGGKLYPRSNEDIEVAGEVKGETTETEKVTPTATQPTVAQPSQTIEVTKPKPAAASMVLTWAPVAGVLGVAGYVWWRRRRSLTPPSPSGRGGMQ